MPEPLLNLVARFPFYAYALVMIFGANFFYQKTSRFSFVEELTERDNPAFGACLAGFLVGAAFAISGAFPTDFSDLSDAAVNMTCGGILAILLLRASLWINHEFIMSKFSIDVEMIKNHNVGAGIAVAGSSVGTGLVLAGALTGDSDGLLNAMRDIIVYWAVGQALFIAGAFAFYKTAGYDVQKTMEHDNNIAAGLSMGGFLVALGIILGAALQNASSDLLGELGRVGILIGVCGPALLLTAILTEKLILPRVNLAKEIAIDRNAAAGMICAAASVCTALLLAAVINNNFN